jgi:hypothetical protein
MIAMNAIRLSILVLWGLLLRGGSVGIYQPMDLLPLQTGFTVATCYSSTGIGLNQVILPPPHPAGNVVVVWNTSSSILSGAPVDCPASPNYAWQYYHNEFPLQNPPVGPQQEWRASQLGEVFGIALDDAVSQNIYVAASRAYGYANWPSGNGPGTVYRLNGVTGVITAFPQLPGASGGTPGPGSGNTNDAALGNLCFHRTPTGQAWLYVTNLGDGRIYRMDPVSGAVTATFDHGVQALPQLFYPAVPDNPGLVYTQPTRRPWGIGVHAGRLYYSVFDGMDPGPPPIWAGAAGPLAEVWSVALDPAGNFLPLTSVREFKIPPVAQVFTMFGNLNRPSMPVSDIEFTAAGAMILAERYHTGCTAPGFAGWGFLVGAHSTRVLEYTGSTSAWVPSPAGKFRVGGGNNPSWVTNSAGGVGPACDGAVWCSADSIGAFSSAPAYGSQRINGTGNATDPSSTTLSHVIDFDCLGAEYGKSLIGDIDTVAPPDRLRAVVINARCPDVPGGPFTVSLNVTNLLPVPMTQLGFGPCPPAFLPPGGQSVVPSPNLVTLNLAPGASTTITVSMAAPPIGGVKCFAVQANPGDFAGTGSPFACAPKLCVRLPKCPCMDVTVKDPRCPVYEGEAHSATLTLTNLSAQTAWWYQLLPCPQNELPPNAVTLQPNPTGLQPLVPPLGPNGVSPPIAVSFPNLPVQNTPLTVCFVVQFLPQFENEGAFCEAKVCITFPPCPPPLPCMTLAWDSVKCPTAPPGNYQLDLSITNNGLVPAVAAVLAPCPPPGGPGVPALPSPALLSFPPLTQGNTFTGTIGLGGVPLTGVNGCFCVTLLDSQQRPICTKVVCIPLPACPCAAVIPKEVKCPDFENQPHVLPLNVTNTGYQPLYWWSVSPCPPQQLPPGALTGVSPGPAGLQPFPVLNPSQSGTLLVNLQGIPKAGGIACFTVSFYGESEGQPVCEQKVCVNVPPCPDCKPCMSAFVRGNALCPEVQNGPFTVPIVITNLQPVPAWTAQLIPCTPGLQPGEVAAIPVPGTINLGPLLQNNSLPITVGLTGVSSGQLACFCIRLFDAVGNFLCESPVCVRLPDCPPLCARVTTLEVVCRPNGTFANLSVFNQSAATFGFYATTPVPTGQLPPGAITGQPQPAGLWPFTPNLAPGNTGNVTITLPPNLPPAGSTFCFYLEFYSPQDQLICREMVCLRVPACACAIILNHDVKCVPGPGGMMVPQLTFTVQNLTNAFGTPFSFAAATILPGAGFSPSVITPSPNPIPPGGTGTFTTLFTGSRPPTCLDIFLTDAARKFCCPLRLCPLWVSCAQPEGPHRCDIASQFSVGPNSLANASAWICNGSNQPQTFTWSVAPAAVPGCTSVLPPNAFVASSGTVGPVGPGSSILVPFTVSGATVAAGTCAGFQFCFQPVSQKKTQPICCLSKISRPRDKDLVIEWNPAGRTLLTAHGLVTLAVRNLSPETVTASFLLGQSGTTELSLDGNFATGADGSSGTPQNTLPFDLTIPGNSAVPLTLHARAVSTIFPGITPWNEWSIIRLCRNGTPTEVEIIGTALFHAPQQLPAPAGSAAGMSMNGRLTLNWAASTAAFPALACEIPDGHTTELLASPSLKSWQRVWPVGENLLHFPDGSFTASQQNTFLQTPDTPAEKQFFRLRSRN